AVKDSMGGPVAADREVVFMVQGHPPGFLFGSIVPKSAVTDNNGVAKAEYGWIQETGAASMATIRAYASPSVYTSATITIKAPDTTAPMTKLTTAGESDNAGGFITDVTCTLTASDPGGWGVNSTYYRVGHTGWREYTGPFTITSEGGTTVYYYSTDLAGNTEKPQYRTIVIHKK
ncbi:MAG TPA: hypothetical protein VMC61_04250, partial [Methanocella sp.]|nr:hypothetical protein [Methanocella sp.]